MSHESAPSSEKPRIRTPKVLRRVGEATLDTLARLRILPDDTESGRPLEERHIPQKTPAELGARAVGNGLISLRRSRHSKRGRAPGTFLSVDDATRVAMPGLNPRYLYGQTRVEDGVNSAYRHLIHDKERRH